MSKLLARITVLALLILLSVATMIYGWGLTPRSWGWIVGMGFFGNVALMVLNHFLDKEEEK
ncbi:MAG TPA: hypothetical protein VKP61_00065 [Candidatus Acidoferrum sp.]|nr:hypothetical protein [Candidatus Acidoferrum sp.]